MTGEWKRNGSTVRHFPEIARSWNDIQAITASEDEFECESV